MKGGGREEKGRGKGTFVESFGRLGAYISRERKPWEKENES